MLCSSPMSAKTRRRRWSASPRRRQVHPACAISASSPTVLSATVLPPVLGPVINSTSVGAPLDRDGRDIAFEQRVAGLEQPRTDGAVRQVAVLRGRCAAGLPARRRHLVGEDVPSPGAGRARPAPRRSSDRLGGSAPTRPPASAACVRLCCSSICSSRRFGRSTTASGSTNSVAPLADWSCTMPRISARYSAFTGST